jgi:sulfate permease, SulP family
MTARPAVVPGFTLFRHYDRSWLRWDALAGVTVAAYLIPQVMAYAGLAGVDPVAGLWAALPAMAIYAILGSSRQLSVGPESTTSLMTASVVAPLAAGDSERYAALAAALAIVVGLVAFVAWVARLGFVADLLSHPVLVGYMAGVALIMISGQLDTITGVPVEGRTFAAEVLSFARGIGELHVATLVLSLATLVFLFAVHSRFPRAPGPLLAVLLATAVFTVLNPDEWDIDIIGEIPAALPSPTLPPIDVYPELVLPAFGVLIVAYTDNVLTGRAFAIRGGYRVDANQELLALAGANVGAGCLQGFPVSSSGSRTAIGDATGSRSQAYSLVALIAVLAVLLFFRPVLARFPMASLGAIVVYAAIRLIDIPGFRRLAAFRRNEFFLAIAACIGVLVFGILYGILVAVGLSVAELLYRVARAHDAVQAPVPGLAGMHDIDDHPDAEPIPGLVVYRYDAPLFFANAQDFKNRALAAVDAAPDPVQWFVFNVEGNVEVDITALDALEELRNELTKRGIVFALARVKQDLLTELKKFGLANRIGADRLFPTLPTATDAFEEWRKTRSNGGH